MRDIAGGGVMIKGRIVAESYGPGGVVSEVVRRQYVAATPVRLTQGGTRRYTEPADRRGVTVRSGCDGAARPAVTVAEAATQNSTTITIEIGGAAVHAVAGVSSAWLRDVLRAVRVAT